MQKFVLIIHDVRSVHNVGSLFRTADGMGVSKIYLTGYTPGSIDRFGRKVAAFTKVSLGAEDTVSWEQGDIAEILSQLKEQGFDIVALEQTSRSVSLADYEVEKPVALIVGNEVGGIDAGVLEAVDVVVEIPMKGKKESLNVANAGAIALWELTKNSPHQ